MKFTCIYTYIRVCMQNMHIYIYTSWLCDSDSIKLFVCTMFFSLFATTTEMLGCFTVFASNVMQELYRSPLCPQKVAAPGIYLKVRVHVDTFHSILPQGKWQGEEAYCFFCQVGPGEISLKGKNSSFSSLLSSGLFFRFCELFWMWFLNVDGQNGAL